MTKKELIEELVKLGKKEKEIKDLKNAELEELLKKAQAEVSTVNDSKVDVVDPNQTSIPGTEETKSENAANPPKVEPTKKIATAKEEPLEYVVLSKVNMINNDGTAMQINKMCKLSKKEYNRLKNDKRGPFFEEL